MDGHDLPELDDLELIVVVDNETDTLSSVDEGLPQHPELASLMARIPPTRHHDGHPGHVVFDHLCVACHGFSVLGTGRSGEQVRSVLFDVGPYGDVWLDNVERLGVDIATIETVFLSHWHADHSGGFPTVVGAIADARAAASLPAPVVDVHPHRPDQRGILNPAGVFVMLPPEPSFHELSAAGGTVERNADAHAVADLFYGSGAIDRITEYETGLVGHHSFRGDACEPDPLIMDERFLAAHVRGRGVTVLSACSHAGVVNACLGAMTAYPDTAIDVIIGGYHLAGKAMEPRIDDTVRDLLERIDPAVVAPGHCTGWRAKAALSAAFAPGRYAPSVVGSRYHLTAPGP